MGKAARIVLLLVLSTFQVFLLSPFMPARWRAEMFGWMATTLPQSYDHSRITHPEIDHEIDRALTQHPALRLATYGLLYTLLAANAFAMIWVVKRREDTSG